MQYKILEVNEKDSWVKFDTVLKDGTKYTKRMMVDLNGGRESVEAEIVKWYEQYHKDLARQADASELKGLVGKTQTVGK